MAIKCIKCGKRVAEADAILMDVTFSPRTLSGGQKTGPQYHQTLNICPNCQSAIINQSSGLVDLVAAGIQGRAYTFPFRLPQVGESVFEVIDDKYPIIESVITKFERGTYEAECRTIPDAGTLSFSPFDIGRKLFLTKKEAQKYKTMLFQTEQAEFDLEGGLPDDGV